jgi:hypothetical protein
MRTAPDQMMLPRINEVPSSVAFTAVARKLEATYSDVVAEGLPEPLAGLAERLSREDRPHPESSRGSLNRTLDHAVGLAEEDAGQEQGGEGTPNSPLLAVLVVLGLGYGLAWTLHKFGSREGKRVLDGVGRGQRHVPR